MLLQLIIQVKPQGEEHVREDSFLGLTILELDLTITDLFRVVTLKSCISEMVSQLLSETVDLLEEEKRF